MKHDLASRRHLFVALEGGDGSGKTSMRKYIFAMLREQGIIALSCVPVSWLRPKCTEIITKAKYFNHRFSPERVLDAYATDKEEMTRRIIEPHLPWRPVISDRFILSDIVYNEILFGIPAQQTAARYIESAIREPDMIIFLNTPPPTARARLDLRTHTQRHSWEDLEPLKRIYRGFQNVLLHNPIGLRSEFVTIDNSGSLDESYRQVDRLVKPALTRSAREATAVSQDSEQ